MPRRAGPLRDTDQDDCFELYPKMAGVSAAATGAYALRIKTGDWAYGA